MNLVSVILPVYNAASSLARTIESVFNQTYENIELIIIDDGSTDKSLEIANHYSHIENIRIITQINSGASVARNNGINIARGKYLQFLDAGDVLSLDKIKIQVESLCTHPLKVAVCNYKQFTSNKDLIDNQFQDQSHFIYSSDNPHDFLINLWGGKGSMNFIQTNCWLIPRLILEKSGNWRNFRCPDDDGEFFARVLLASDGIIYTPSVVNYYHISTNGDNHLSKSKNYKYQMNSLLTIDLKYEYLKKFGYHPFLNRAIAAQYYRYAIDMYPSRRVLSLIAWKRFISFKETPPTIILGGKIIQFIHQVFGWKIARLIKYYFREK